MGVKKIKRGRLHKDQKRAEAESRQEARNNRTDKEQLARLDTLLGKGVGAEKERKRLNG